MQFPTMMEYDAEVLNLARSVKDRRFHTGQPQFTRLGGVKAYSGGFSRVYPIDVNGKTVALRCWVSDIGGRHKRYREVAAYLGRNQLPYFVDFDYITDGISVQGRTYPVVYMTWVDGLTLGEYIDANHTKRDKMVLLADEFLKMAQRLHTVNMAHGDLQDGNILVVEENNTIALKLIDYDTMFVPALTGWKNDSVFIPDYQHPLRERAQFVSEKDDYFSELVIYLSIRAVAERPSLWKSGTERKLLFSREDFSEPEASDAFQRIAGLSPELRGLADALRSFCRAGSISELTPLEGVVGSSHSLKRERELALDTFFKRTRDVTSARTKLPDKAVTSLTPRKVPVEIANYFGSPAAPPAEPKRDLVPAAPKAPARAAKPKSPAASKPKVPAKPPAQPSSFVQSLKVAAIILIILFVLFALGG